MSGAKSLGGRAGTVTSSPSLLKVLLTKSAHLSKMPFKEVGVSASALSPFSRAARVPRMNRKGGVLAASSALIASLVMSRKKRLLMTISGRSFFPSSRGGARSSEVARAKRSSTE